VTDFDAVIVGAGVAGCAAAVELLSVGWRVGLLRKGTHTTRVESLSPGAVLHLNKLSIDVGQAVSEVVAWWGSEQEKRVIYPHSRMVERGRLADALRRRALERGATEEETKNDLSIERVGGRWRLAWEEPSAGPRRVTTAYLIDGSGRAAVVARRLGAKRAVVDQLFSIAVDIVEPRIVGTWTESRPTGWWNLSSLEEKGTLSFYSSALMVREVKSGVAAQFEETEHLRTLLSTRRFLNSTVSACDSSFLGPCAGPGWLAVGDAAWTAQPLASVGVAKALRDARTLWYWLEHEWSRYDRFQRAEFDAYLRQLKQHYFLEKRWPTRPFWRTRAQIAGNNERAEPSLTTNLAI
jgi:flavin-dependent dehydrogenase